MQCAYPRAIKNGDKKFYVPCGMCLACRYNKTTEWTIRLLFEKQFYSDCMFITLTYDDEHLPTDCSLKTEDLQKFWKRLRKRCAKNGYIIRYFACGEYGENPRKQLDSGFGRPHYHAIIFGLPITEMTRRFIADSWPFCDSTFFTDSKRKGIGFCSEESIKYVTGYIRKKLLGFDKQKYEDAGIIPPFQRSSQGLGLLGFEEYVKKQGENFDGFIHYRGYKVPVPRYFDEKTGLVDKSRLKAQMDIAKINYLVNIHGYNRDDLMNNIDLCFGDGLSMLDYTYTEAIREKLVQRHNDRIKLFNINKRGNI